MRGSPFWVSKEEQETEHGTGWPPTCCTLFPRAPLPTVRAGPPISGGDPPTRSVDPWHMSQRAHGGCVVLVKRPWCSHLAALGILNLQRALSRPCEGRRPWTGRHSAGASSVRRLRLVEGVPHAACRTPTAAAISRTDSPRSRRALIAASLSSSTTRGRPPTLPRRLAASSPSRVFRLMPRRRSSASARAHVQHE